MVNWIQIHDKVIDAGKKVRRFGAVNNILNEIDNLEDTGSLFQLILRFK